MKNYWLWRQIKKGGDALPGKTEGLRTLLSVSWACFYFKKPVRFLLVFSVIDISLLYERLFLVNFGSFFRINLGEAYVFQDIEYEEISASILQSFFFYETRASSRTRTNNSGGVC